MCAAENKQRRKKQSRQNIDMGVALQIIQPHGRFAVAFAQRKNRFKAPVCVGTVQTAQGIIYVEFPIFVRSFKDFDAQFLRSAEFSLHGRVGKKIFFQHFFHNTGGKFLREHGFRLEFT